VLLQSIAKYYEVSKFRVLYSSRHAQNCLLFTLVGIDGRKAAASHAHFDYNPLTGTLKSQSNGPLYSNAVIGTLAVDGWAVTFGTARRGLGTIIPLTLKG